MTSSSRTILATSLISASGIFLEITLTRLLSALYYPQTVFVVLSLAILGISIGAGLATTTKSLRTIRNVSYTLAIASVSTFFLAVVVIQSATSSDMIISGIAMTVPYIGIGLALSTLFSQQHEQSHALYAADLLGAGLATILIVPILNLLGAVNGMLLCGVMFIVAATILDSRQIQIYGIVIAIIIFGSNLSGEWLDVDMATLGSEKPIVETLIDGEILETRWDSFARTDLAKPADGSYRIYVDGAAASIIPPALNNEHLIHDIGLFAFATAQPQSVFTIGSGGGLDVWFGLTIGASDITATEVNAQSVQLVEDYASYSGDIYNHPNVRVIVDEGRSVLRREEKLYDLIFMSQVVTLTSERAGYAMTENSVFTLEAFTEYLDHLNDNGYLSIKLYDELTMSRALSLAIDALKLKYDIDDVEALNHIIALLDPSTSPPVPLLMIKNSPFLEEEVISIGSTAQRVGFATLFLPYIQADPPLDAVVNGVNTYQEVIDISPINLSSPTDNKPFFYQFERGLPDELQDLVTALGAIVIVVLVLLVAYYWFTRIPRFFTSAGYFSGLGVGFIMVELGLIQQARLLIGHPTISITLVIASLLIGGGLGNILYNRSRTSTSSLYAQPLLIIAGLIIVWQVFWAIISPSLIGSSSIIRIGTVALMIFPLGLAMGIPFPAGLSAIGNTDKRLVTMAWGLNGVFSVVGSALTLVVALTAGFSTVYWIACATYLFVALLAYLHPNKL